MSSLKKGILLVTSLYAGLLTLFYFVISIATIKARRSKGISLGSGSDDEIIHLVSAHNNFSSYVPLFLILLYLLETQGSSQLWIHALAMPFAVGRFFHFQSMKTENMNLKKRVLGMRLTLIPLVLSAFGNVFIYLKTYIF